MLHAATGIVNLKEAFRAKKQKLVRPVPSALDFELPRHGTGAELACVLGLLH
jgi:hypothetical protein